MQKIGIVYEFISLLQITNVCLYSLCIKITISIQNWNVPGSFILKTKLVYKPERVRNEVRILQRNGGSHNSADSFFYDKNSPTYHTLKFMKLQRLQPLKEQKNLFLVQEISEIS